MFDRAIQTPVVVLPVIAPTGTEVELVNDAVTHVSIEPANMYGGTIMAHLVEKTAFVFAQEIVVAGLPGALNIWVEQSPYPTTVSGLYWSAIGGGGGFLPPVVFDTINGIGVNGTVHGLGIPWNTHAPYYRIVVQTPVPAAGAFWAVQVLLAGRGA